ncbi:hypothetical protein GCM10009658_18410 [Planotetraspora silvatica]
MNVNPDQDPVELLANLTRRLGMSEYAGFTTVQQGRDALAAVLRRRRLLIVVDNVWEPAPVQALLGISSRCGLLFTTRVQEIATTLHAVPVEIKALSESEALELLGQWTGQPVAQLPVAAHRLCTRVGNLALGVAMSGAMVANGRSFDDVLMLIEQDLVRVHADLDPVYQYRTLFAAVSAGLADLDEVDRVRYERLAVFAGRGPFSRDAAEKLWGPELSAVRVGDLLGELIGRSLLTAAGQNWYVAHDLQYDVMISRLGGEGGKRFVAAHGHLLDQYRHEYASRWELSADDPYLASRLAAHLDAADCGGELRKLLANVAWIQRRLVHSRLAVLLADYGYADDPLTKQIARALRLSADAITTDPALARAQLAGRLWDNPNRHVAAWARDLLDLPEPVLRPTGITPALTPTTASLLQVLTGHTGRVRVVAITADGATVVSGGGNGLRVRNLNGAHEPRILGQQEGRVVAITADGTTVVSRGSDGALRVWNLNGAHELRILGRQEGTVDAVAITPDGATVVSASGNALRVWNLNGAPEPRILGRQEGTVDAVAITPDGATVVSASGNALRVWNLNGAHEPRILGQHASRVVAISADGATVVSGGLDGAVRVWDLNGAPEPRILGRHAGSVDALAITTDGTTIVSGGSDATVRVWNLNGAPEPRILGQHAGSVDALAITTDGTTIVSGGSDGALRVWDLNGAPEPRFLGVHAGWVRMVAISADGATVVSGGLDGAVRVWDLNGAPEPRILGRHAGSVDALAITTDGTTIVSGGSDATVRVWDLSDAPEPRILGRHAGSVDALAITTDGTTIVSGGSDGAVRVWDLNDAPEPRILGQHAGSVDALAITTDGTTIVSGGSDGALRVWNLNGAPEPRFLGQHAGWVRVVAISTDGATVVSGGSDGALRVWDLNGAPEPRILGRHAGSVDALAITTDGTTIVSGGSDGAVRVWNLTRSDQTAYWVGDHPVVACTVWSEGCLQVGVGQVEGAPYVLELCSPRNSDSAGGRNR